MGRLFGGLDRVELLSTAKQPPAPKSKDRQPRLSDRLGQREGERDNDEVRDEQLHVGSSSLVLHAPLVAERQFGLSCEAQVEENGDRV